MSQNVKGFTVKTQYFNENGCDHRDFFSGELMHKKKKLSYICEQRICPNCKELVSMHFEPTYVEVCKNE